MILKEYNKKRNFKKTPEPLGKKSKQQKFLYIIQKHAASHLHYDFRLELGGALKSWAVPKGPSLDPTVKRLAVHVEDHPIEYGSFEGIIPAGEYGGGTVMLWDKGTWIPQDDNPEKAYKNGSMSVILKGKKLKGLWKLVRLKTDPKNWLLIKSKDDYARSSASYDVTEAEPLSVVSKRSMNAIAGTKDSSKENKPAKKKASKKTINSNILVKKSKIPKTIDPQLATLVDRPPIGKQWLHEIKFDGYRLICFIINHKIKLITRRHQDWTAKFPDLVSHLENLPVKNAIFDGEIVVLDKKNISRFQLLQNAIHHEKQKNIIYYLFDLLYYDDYDLTNVPLLKRKELLHQLILEANDPTLRFSEYVLGNGNRVFEKSCRKGQEGIISKLIDGTYIQKRTRDWCKSKCVKRQEFIVCGYTKPRGKRAYFGSLLLAVYDGHILKYCGHVGTGFTEESLEDMAHLLQEYKSLHMPFANTPPDAKYVTWVKPQIVIEVEFSEWTEEGILRTPSFKGVRSDKLPKDVIMEKPTHKKTIHKNSTSNHTLLKLTHPDKLLYPEARITKLQFAEYYLDIAPWILPYLSNRPLTLVRCPNGWNQKCFFQKHLHEIDNDSLHTVAIKEKNKTEHYIYIKDKTGLLTLAQMGVLEIHVWNCHIDKVEKPDMIVFDLDPAPDVEWKKVIHAARFIRDNLEKINLQSFVRTTGGKGLHVVIPIKRQYDWDEIIAFSQAFVNYLVALKPNDYIGTMSKAKRTGKIFIDYLRNLRGATAISSYSTRALKNAPIATPLSWDELTTKIKPDSFTLTNLPKRLAKLKNDPWEEFFSIKQSLIN